MKRARKIIILAVLICPIFSFAVCAEDQTRLRSSLEDMQPYYSVTIEELNSSLKNNPKAFKESFDDRLVIVSGLIKTDSISEDKENVIIYGKGSENAVVKINTDDCLKLVGDLRANDKITVCGHVDCSGIKNIEYTVIADFICENGDVTNHSYAYWDKENKKATGYNGVLVDDLTDDQHITYRIPDSWQYEYVKSDLTNNGIKGYQYSLNALVPQNTAYPEIFYVFYFDNDTYLKKSVRNAPGWYNERIEKLIVKNIMSSLKEEEKIKIQDVETTNDIELDYCTMTNNPGGGTDTYRFEFLFKPDEKGITCMLYLYYPSDKAVNHLSDVVYVVDSLNGAFD